MQLPKTRNSADQPCKQPTKPCTCGGYLKINYAIRRIPPTIEESNILWKKNPKSECTCGAAPVPRVKMPDGQRRLKVQPKYVRLARSRFSIIPQVLLAGEWFRNAGFEIGDHIVIVQKRGKLVIERERENRY